MSRLERRLAGRSSSRIATESLLADLQRPVQAVKADLLERFVSDSHCALDGDPSLVVGWAGWDTSARRRP